MTETEFINLIQQHSGIIHKILYLYIDDPEEKQDLKQEIQLQAWRAKDRFRGDSAFSTWLYRVALNTVLTFQRKRKITATSLENVEVKLDNKEKSERSEWLLRAIKGLTDIDKTIITLHLEDYDNGEIAEIIGLTKNNVGVKLHRIKEILKKKLKGVSEWTN